MADDEVMGDATESGEPQDMLHAVKEVVQRALANDGLVRGLKETAKTLDRDEGLLCLLAADCGEQAYVKLIEALCAEHRVDLVKVPERKKL
eukprot:256005_1